jgi:RNA polymerase sigma factor (TIGR02999 family)
MKPSSQDVTQMLLDWGNGHKEALDQLTPLVYDELHRLAARYLRRERPGHTLQTTALVHEVYLRLVNQDRVQWQNRAHFLSIAATMMRRVLVNYAESHRAAKRGGTGPRLSLEAVADWADERAANRAVDFVVLDEALTRLAAIDAQQSRIIELRFFGGLTVEEVAEALGLSPATVQREWRMARAWLRHTITK